MQKPETLSESFIATGQSQVQLPCSSRILYNTTRPARRGVAGHQALLALWTRGHSLASKTRVVVLDQDVGGRQNMHLEVIDLILAGHGYSDTGTFSFCLHLARRLAYGASCRSWSLEGATLP